jgi:hypothetical protein
VWQDPVAETEPEPEPVEKPVAEAVIESPQDAVAAPAATEPAASEPAAPELGFVAAEEPAAAPNSAPVENVDDDWAASLARWDDVDTTSAPPDALPIFGDAPPVSYSQRAMKYQPMHGRTSPVWLIVFMPVLHALCVVGSVYVFPGLLELDATIALTPSGAAALAMLPVLRDWLLFALLPLSVAFWVFTFIMGFQDRARLRLLGHDTTASPWWIALNPLIYLIVRSVRVRQCTGRRGSGPLTTYLCLYIAPPPGSGTRELHHAGPRHTQSAISGCAASPAGHAGLRTGGSARASPQCSRPGRNTWRWCVRNHQRVIRGRAGT